MRADYNYISHFYFLRNMNNIKVVNMYMCKLVLKYTYAKSCVKRIDTLYVNV